MTLDLETLFERRLPAALEARLEDSLGDSMPRLGLGATFRIASAGRFSGRIAADLLAHAQNQKMDAAFLLVEEEVVRVLYFEGGHVIGAGSNVLFERLGRVLGRADVVSTREVRALVECEEQEGLAAAARRLPPDAARWGLERRVWEIGAGLYFMPHAYFLFIEGRPILEGLPRLALSPIELSMEGMRRYDEWRHGRLGPAHRPAPPPVPAPVPGRRAPVA